MLNEILNINNYSSERKIKLFLDDDLLIFDLLLPQQSTSLVTSPKLLSHILKTYKFMLSNGLEAIDCFLSKDYKKFDAQVGDTLCQIRAFKVFLLSKEHSLKKQLKNLRAILLEKLAIIKRLHIQAKQKQSSNRFNKNKSISEHLFYSDLVLSINKSAAFLICSYILTKYNVINDKNIPSSINEAALQADLLCSRRFAKRLIHHHQKMVAEWSCEIIYTLNSSIESESISNAILPELMKHSEEERKVLPCITVTSIILKYCLQYKLAFIIAVENSLSSKIIYYMCKPHNSNFIIKKCTPKYNAAFLILKGYTKLTCNKADIAHEFNSLGIKNIILANSVQHPQYSGKLLESYCSNPYVDLFYFKINELVKVLKGQFLGLDFNSLKQQTLYLLNLLEEYEQYYMFSQKYGCGRKNTSYFNLEHIYCNTLFSELLNTPNATFFNPLMNNIYYLN